MSTKVWIPPAHTRKLKRMSLTFCELKMKTAAAKSLQPCPTLPDPIVSSPPGSPVPGILQARTLEWVAMSFSNTWKWKVKVKLLSRVRLLVTPWTAAYQAPPSMGFSRQEHWSGLPLPSPENEDYISVTKVCLYICVFLSNVLLFVATWTVTCQAPLSTEFPRQGYWSGLPLPIPGNLPVPWVELKSHVSPALAGRSFTINPNWEAHLCMVALIWTVKWIKHFNWTIKWVKYLINTIWAKSVIV